MGELLNPMPTQWEIKDAARIASAIVVDLFDEMKRVGGPDHVDGDGSRALARLLALVPEVPAVDPTAEDYHRAIRQWALVCASTAHIAAQVLHAADQAGISLGLDDLRG